MKQQGGKSARRWRIQRLATWKKHAETPGRRAGLTAYSWHCKNRALPIYRLRGRYPRSLTEEV